MSQDGYPSKVYIQWFRVIDAYYANNTLPLNVTTIDIADIKSRIMVRTQTLLSLGFSARAAQAAGVLPAIDARCPLRSIEWACH